MLAGPRRRHVEVIDEIEPLHADLRIAALDLRGGAHLVPILRAVQHSDTRLALIWQGSPRFRFIGRQPIIGIVGDDTDRALGPDGFHRKSVAAFLATCSTISIVSSGPKIEPYAAGIGVALVLQKNFAVIETRPEQELPWETFARRAQPNAQIIICRPRRH